MGHFIQTTMLLMRTHLFALVFSRRFVICLLLASAPVIIAWFAGTYQDAEEVVSMLGLMMILGVVAPLLSLAAGSSVVTEEIESRTITYIFTRPCPRGAFFVGRLLSSSLLSSVLLALSSLGVVWAATYSRGGQDDLRRVWEHRPKKGSGPKMVEIVRALPDDLALHLVCAGALGALIYTLISAGLGVFFKRAMIACLGYTFAIEGFLANIPGSTQKLSVQFYLRSILTGGPQIEESPFDFVPMLGEVELYSPQAAVTHLAGIYAVLLLISVVGIRRRQYMLTS